MPSRWTVAACTSRIKFSTSRWTVAAVILFLYLLLLNPKQVISKRRRIPGSIIPAKIHQAWSRVPFNDYFRLFNNKRNMKAWRDNNPDFEYYLWSDADAETFVKDKYPQYINDYLKLSPLAKVNVFKYMVLFKEGGIYSDARTIPIKPLNDWIKQSWLCNDVNFIAGVESLENDFQLCEWTIASVPNHEILNTTITQIFDIIQKSNLEEKEFMETIGFAGRFSSVIFKTWENLGYTLDDFKEFGSDPKCLSKKLILPSAFFNPGMIYNSNTLVKYDGSINSQEKTQKFI